MKVIPLNERQTVRSSPPISEHTQKRSYWPGVFTEARECQGEWVRTVKTFGRATAQQLASDIRNAHQRDPKKFRIRGVEEGEIWDARWGRPSANADEDEFVVWIRLVSTTTSRAALFTYMTDHDIW
jgi:hypothetical protein